RAIAIRRGQAGERLTDGRILCRNAIGIPANVAVSVPVEGDALVGTSGTLQHSDDLALLVSVDDTINDTALLAVLEIGLVLKDKAQVVAALSLAMTRIQIVADDAIEHEGIRHLVQAPLDVFALHAGDVAVRRLATLVREAVPPVGKHADA